MLREKCNAVQAWFWENISVAQSASTIPLLLANTQGFLRIGLFYPIGYGLANFSNLLNFPLFFKFVHIVYHRTAGYAQHFPHIRIGNPAFFLKHDQRPLLAPLLLR